MDRCHAVGERMADRATVLAVEVASASETYAWAPSGDISGVHKVTLFPGGNYHQISRWRRFWSMWTALRSCQYVFFGIPYSAPEVIALSWLLRVLGVRVIMMTDSKFDDLRRSSLFELGKAMILSAYQGAIVAGRRQYSYLHFLGFGKRPTLLGYDVISVARIRAEAVAARSGPPISMAERDFLFVGRFVAKKRLPQLIDAYAAYVERAGIGARRLVLVGAGPEEAAIRDRVAELGLVERVVFTGFLQGAEIAAALDRALALLLVSTEEQWGLVVNEAVALGLPVIVSAQAGASDLLVRNLVNGYQVQPDDQATIVEAMCAVASDETRWAQMSAQSLIVAERGDVARFADAVELMFQPGVEPATSRYAAFAEEILSLV